MTDNIKKVGKTTSATDLITGTLDGDRLPALSATKKGRVPMTGVPSGKFLKDDNTWASAGGAGTPGDTVTYETSFGISSSAGVGTDYSRSDHTHGTPTNPVTGHESSYTHTDIGLNTAARHSNASDPVADEKAALAGTSGTPSVTNKYVTNDDSRNTNARTPTSHNNTQHSATYIVVADVTDANMTTTDVVTNDVGITKHGFVPKAPNNTTTFLRGDATWAAPGGSSPTGVFKDLQISILQSDGTLNADANAQTWCGTAKTAQDVFTVTANTTYLVEGQYIMNTGATTHTTGMVWALSSATVTCFQYQTLLWSAAVNTIATVQSTTHVSGAALKVINATSTAVYTIISFKGVLVIGTGGTVTPQIKFSANPTGTNLMKAGSWVSFSKIGADTFTCNGGWA